MRNALLPLCVVLAGCGAEVKARDVPPLDSPVSPVAGPPDAGAAVPATVTGSIDLPAIVYSDLDADVGARRNGVLTSISAELGDRVRPGQTLAALDDSRERAQHAAALAALDRARADHARAAGLHERGFVTQAQLEEARYLEAAAAAQLRVAEVELEHTRVIAPFGGVVTSRTARLGRTVQEGDPLFRVTALAPLRATARVPERDARGLAPGARAQLITAEGAAVDVRVTRVSPAVDAGSGTVEVLFSVPQPGSLLPGSAVLLRLGIREIGEH